MPLRSDLASASDLDGEDEPSISLSLLDSNSLDEISQLDFRIAQSENGNSVTKRIIAQISTANITGYKLYMESDFQLNDSYITDLVNVDGETSSIIPTSVLPSTLYWNYTNPLEGVRATIPSHGNPDIVAQSSSVADSVKVPIDINVSVDDSIVTGDYKNSLLFTAITNPNEVNYSISFNTDGGTPEIATITESAMAGVYSITIPETVPTKEGYVFQYWLDKTSDTTYSPGDVVAIYSDENLEGSVSLTAIYRQESTLYTLTIDANGGTYGGESSYTITGYSGDSVHIYNPEYSYSVSFKDNGQDATYPAFMPDSADIYFDDYELSGDGTYADNYYTFGTGDDILTAKYKYDGKYASLYIPTITKSGYSCAWAMNGTSGRQYVGGTNAIIEGDTTFYAVCTTNTISNITTMQQMTPSICANTSVGTSKTLKDSRDSSTYTIEKLSDGSCWMTQNLRFVPASGSKLMYTSSDVVDNIVWEGSDCDSNGFDSSNACVYYDNDATYGAYYNWTAATATAQVEETPFNDYEKVYYSVCPKGWTVPSRSHFDTLLTFYENDYDKLTNDGPGFVLSGKYSPQLERVYLSLNSVGSPSMSNSAYGYYISAKLVYYTMHEFLVLRNSGDFYKDITFDTFSTLNNFLLRPETASIRCVARDFLSG